MNLQKLDLQNFTKTAIHENKSLWFRDLTTLQKLVLRKFLPLKYLGYFWHHCSNMLSLTAKNYIIQDRRYRYCFLLYGDDHSLLLYAQLLTFVQQPCRPHRQQNLIFKPRHIDNIYCSSNFSFNPQNCAKLIFLSFSFYIQLQQ